MSRSLEQVFAEVLEAPVSAMSVDASPDTLRSWNSLKHIELITALEEEFQVQFTTADGIAMQSLGAARTILQRKGIVI
jgi:acyl carrier protein